MKPDVFQLFDSHTLRFFINVAVDEVTEKTVHQNIKEAHTDAGRQHSHVTNILTGSVTAVHSSCSQTFAFIFLHLQLALKEPNIDSLKLKHEVGLKKKKRENTVSFH